MNFVASLVPGLRVIENGTLSMMYVSFYQCSMEDVSIRYDSILDEFATFPHTLFPLNAPVMRCPKDICSIFSVRNLKFKC